MILKPEILLTGEADFYPPFCGKKKQKTFRKMTALFKLIQTAS